MNCPRIFAPLRYSICQKESEETFVCSGAWGLSVIPANAGTQSSANGKTGGKPKGNAINRIVPDLGSRFRGNDGWGGPLNNPI